MSRSTKPKPWHRPRNVFLALVAAVVLFFGWAFLEVWQVYTAEPNPAVDYRAKMRELAEQHAGVSRSDGEEAWALLVEILDQVDQIHSSQEGRIAESGFEARDEYDQGSIEYDRVYYRRAFPANVQREIDAIDRIRNEGVFDLLQKFVASSPGIGPLGPDVPLSADIFKLHLPKARMLAQLLTAAMRLSLTKGDYQLVAARCEEALALSSTISHQGTLIDYLVAMAIEQLTLRELRYELNDVAFDEAICDRILDSVRKHDLARVNLPIEGERIQLYDDLQWSFSDDGNGDGYLVSGLAQFTIPGFTEPKQTIIGATMSRFLYPSRAELLNLGDRMIDGCLARSLLLQSSGFSATSPLARPGSDFSDRYLMVTLVVESLQKTVDRQPSRWVSREGTRIMLAIEAFYARHSRWPGALDELVPDILPKAPIDPIHGGTFGYRLVDNDRFGRPYILYSFGLDATDDGGVEPESYTRDVYRGIEPLTDYNLTGVDFIINKPRPEEW